MSEANSQEVEVKPAPKPGRRTTAPTPSVEDLDRRLDRLEETLQRTLDAFESRMNAVEDMQDEAKTEDKTEVGTAAWYHPATTTGKVLASVGGAIASYSAYRIIKAVVTRNAISIVE